MKLSGEGFHEAHTPGTLAFMACEVARGRYIAKGLPNETYRPRPRSFPTFFHNPLHDLESIWWICLWGVCLHYVQEDPVRERLRAQLREAINLFAVTSLHARFLMLNSSLDAAQSEYRVYLDREFPEIAEFLEDTGSSLYTRYCHIIDSTTEQIDMKMFNDIHSQIIDSLKPCLEATQKLGNKWHLYDNILARCKEGEWEDCKYTDEDENEDEDESDDD